MGLPVSPRTEGSGEVLPACSPRDRWDPERPRSSRRWLHHPDPWAGPGAPLGGWGVTEMIAVVRNNEEIPGYLAQFDVTR